jgi:hypothetical protein
MPKTSPQSVLPPVRPLLKLLATAGIVLAASGASARAADVSTTFDVPGSSSFTVPGGVSSIDITAIGSPGGFCGTERGGSAGLVEATVPVTPGQRLSIGVGAAGTPGCGQSSIAGGAGGAGGGGAGGRGGSAGKEGGGGGGASFVGFGPSSQQLPASLLVVAAGGGGAGPAIAGGNAESPGGPQGDGINGSSGEAGTADAGGTGGVGGQPTRVEDPRFGTDGSAGNRGVGGDGGDGSIDPSSTGGGGGGSGYFGGGGGGGGSANGSGGGGGGGANFVIPTGTNVGTSNAVFGTPSVTIVYAGPSAEASATSLSFGSQPQGSVGPEQVLTLTNRGGSPLIVSGALLAGANAGDYLIGNRCQQPVDPGSSCEIGIRLSPEAQGARSASLTVLSNAANAVPLVSLTGTGGPAAQGVAGPAGPGGPSGRTGTTGPAGPAGAAGATGPAGPAGSAGATGPAGAPGKIELITCTLTATSERRGGRTVRVAHQHCSGRLVTGIVTFTVAASSVQATISRRGKTYGTGVSVPGRNGGYRLLIKPRQRLRSGLYTLTLIRHRGGRRIMERRQLTVG